MDVDFDLEEEQRQVYDTFVELLCSLGKQVDETTCHTVARQAAKDAVERVMLGDYGGMCKFFLNHEITFQKVLIPRMINWSWWNQTRQKKSS